MKNKTLFTALALAIATPAIVIPMVQPIQEAEAATYSKTFKDITKQNPNYDIIHEMANQGIINGYGDGTFRGANEISRQHAATLVYRYMGDQLPVVNPNAPVPVDLNPNSEHAKAVVALIRAGLLEADSQNQIYPSVHLTRAEMAKILVGAFDLKVKANYDFVDTIDGNSKTRELVRALYSNGITTGYMEDATFRPYESLTRQQFTVFMYRSINMDPTYAAPPIVAPSKDETPVEQTPTTPSDRFDVNNLEPTPKEAYEKYSSKMEDIITKSIPSPKVGLTPDELYAYQTKNFAKYQEKILANSTSGLAARLYTKERIQYYADKEGITFEEMVQILNYVQQTGEVYKGKHITLYYEYMEQKSWMFVVGSRL